VDKLPVGGEIWKQFEFPHLCCYIITGLPGELMARTSDPREKGNTFFVEENGKWTYSQEQLAKLLEKEKYICQGQLRDLVIKDLALVQDGWPLEHD